MLDPRFRVLKVSKNWSTRKNRTKLVLNIQLLHFYLSDLRHDGLGQSSADVRNGDGGWAKNFLSASLEEEAVRVYVHLPEVSTKGGLKSINQGLIVRS